MTSKKNVGGAEKSAPLYPAGKYKCPKCSNHIEVCLRLSAAPVCGKHFSGGVTMLKVGK